MKAWGRPWLWVPGLLLCDGAGTPRRLSSAYISNDDARYLHGCEASVDWCNTLVAFWNVWGEMHALLQMPGSAWPADTLTRRVSSYSTSQSGHGYKEYSGTQTGV